MERENILKELSSNVVSITSCERMKMPESKDRYSIHRENPSPVSSMENILQDVMNHRLFGFIQVDTHVPKQLIPRFSEFPPIFIKGWIGGVGGILRVEGRGSRF